MDELTTLLLNNDPNCVVVDDFTEAKASADEMRREKHVATASATLILQLWW